MKNKKQFFKKLFILAIAISATSLFARWTEAPTLGGTTGLIVTPSAAIQDSTSLGLGYHYVSGGHSIPTMNVGIHPRLELGGAGDIANGNADALFFLKGRLYNSRTTPVALYGNLQFIDGGDNNNNNNDGGDSNVASQVLIVVSYYALGLEMSTALGYTFLNNMGSNIDFSIGGQKNMFNVPWLYGLIDFSNYSTMFGRLNSSRGIFNSGLRAAFTPIRNMGVRFDLLGMDLLDSDRGFGIGAYVFWRL